MAEQYLESKELSLCIQNIQLLNSYQRQNTAHGNLLREALGGFLSPGKLSLPCPLNSGY